jgi:hypothetical protein
MRSFSFLEWKASASSQRSSLAALVILIVPCQAARKGQSSEDFRHPVDISPSRAPCNAFLLYSADPSWIARAVLFPPTRSRLGRSSRTNDAILDAAIPRPLFTVAEIVVAKFLMYPTSTSCMYSRSNLLYKSHQLPPQIIGSLPTSSAGMRIYASIAAENAAKPAHPSAAACGPPPLAKNPPVKHPAATPFPRSFFAR